MSHRKRNDDGYILPKQTASARTIKRWDERHDYIKPKDDGFKKLGGADVKPDNIPSDFKPMKKVNI